MGGHQCESHEGILRSTGRRNNGVDEHTSIVGQRRHKERLVNIAHIERDDWAFGVANLETFLTETLQGIASDIPKALDALRLLLDNVQRLHSSCSSRRCVGSTEDVGATGMAQPVDGVEVGSDESTN